MCHQCLPECSRSRGTTITFQLPRRVIFTSAVAVGVFCLGDLLICLFCLIHLVRLLRTGTASPVARGKEINELFADFNTETFLLPLWYKAQGYSILGTSGLSHSVI